MDREGRRPVGPPPMGARARNAFREARFVRQSRAPMIKHDLAKDFEALARYFALSSLPR